MKSKKPRLFVSHADADKAVVELIVELLIDGVKVPRDRIYCTALPGYRPKPGVEFVKEVFHELAHPDVVVLALLSRNFHERAFCSQELGATWIQQRKLLLQTIPPFDHKSLAGVVEGRQAPTLSKRASLDELRDELSRTFSTLPPRTVDWTASVRRFLSQLGPLAYSIERARAKIEYDLFVSTPMSSVSKDDYRRVRGMALKLIESLKAKATGVGITDFRAYYAAAAFESKAAFDAQPVAVERDLDALQKSENYMLIYDCAVPTSALFEAGMALTYSRVSNYAFRRRSTYFVRQGVKLPFMMEELSGEFPQARRYSYANEAGLLRAALNDPPSFERWGAWKIDKE